MVDTEIIQKVFEELWILITNDKDFDEKVYRDVRLHKGVILLRPEDERSGLKIRVVYRLIQSYADRLPGSFVVATDKQVRFAAD